MKCLKTLTGILLTVLLSACSTVIDDKSVDYSNQTLTGQISEINNTSVTLTLGKLKESRNEEMMQMPADKAEGDFDPSQMGEAPDFENGEQPQLPDGEMPQLPDGEKPDFQNGERPQRPEGDGKHGGIKKPGENVNGDSSTEQLPPDGENGELSEGERPAPDSNFPGMMGKQTVTYSFKAKSSTATIDLNGATVTLADGTSGSLSDLKVGDVTEIIVGEGNKVASVTVYTVSESSEIA